MPGMFTNNSIVCKSPALSPESTSSDIIDVKVAIAMDGVHFSADVLTFKYYSMYRGKRREGKGRDEGQGTMFCLTNT